VYVPAQKNNNISKNCLLRSFNPSDDTFFKEKRNVLSLSLSLDCTSLMLSRHGICASGIPISTSERVPYSSAIRSERDSRKKSGNVILW
jgi:hypothetical protein